MDLADFADLAEDFLGECLGDETSVTGMVLDLAVGFVVVDEEATREGRRGVKPSIDLFLSINILVMFCPHFRKS